MSICLFFSLIFTFTDDPSRRILFKSRLLASSNVNPYEMCIHVQDHLSRKLHVRNQYHIRRLFEFVFDVQQ